MHHKIVFVYVWLNKSREIPETETNELELHWLSTARISATESRVHTSFDLHSYCEAIEDQVFSRALIGAVYRSLLEGNFYDLIFRFAFINMMCVLWRHSCFNRDRILVQNLTPDFTVRLARHN